MTAATTSTGAAVSAKSDSQTTWRTRRHQPAADLIVAHDLKQLAVKHAELLAQDPAGDQQRFDDCGQVRMVRDQLTYSSLELDRAHHANLEAEIAQRATQIVLDVERLGLQKLATGQQHAALLAGQRLYMHRSVQANTHHLCNAARIIAVALVDLCRQRRLHMPGLNTDHRQTRFSQCPVPPLQ